MSSPRSLIALVLASIPNCAHSFLLPTSPFHSLSPCPALSARSPLPCTPGPQFLRTASLLSTPRRGSAVTLRAATGEAGGGGEAGSSPPKKVDRVKVQAPLAQSGCGCWHWGGAHLPTQKHGLRQVLLAIGAVVGAAVITWVAWTASIWGLGVAGKVAAACLSPVLSSSDRAS